MTILARAIAIILLLIAALPVLWAVGIPWPFATKEALALSIGGPSLKPDTGKWTKFGITLIAAGALAVAGILPLMHLGLFPFPVFSPVLRCCLAAQTVVFLLRGGLGFLDTTPASAHEPFRSYNRRYFSPLIIGLGVLCAALFLARGLT